MEKITQEQLKELTKQIVENPDKVYDLTPEEQLALEQHVNPLGNVIPEKKVWANMSVLNFRDSYFRRLHMTGMIGYIYRLADEYEPESELLVATLDYKRKLAQAPPDITQAEKDNLFKEYTERQKLITRMSRQLIKKFLNRHFEYNPDQHVRASHSGNESDSERRPKDEAVKAACATAERAALIDEKLSGKPDLTYKYMRDNILATYTATVEAMNTVRTVLGTILDPEVSLDDKQGILMKKYKALHDQVADMKKIVEPLAAAETLSAWKVDPPVDVYHQYNRYFTNHFEQLKEVVKALYNEKPDIEFSVVFYNAFKSAEAARSHRIQHQADFRSEVFTIENSGVTLLGPYKENRGRVDFYNKNTEVLRRMQEQLEKDHMLGKDLMEKKVKREKAKNIRVAGPDDPELKEYSRAMNTISDLGAKKVLTREEMEKLEKARAVKEDAEVPDDAIQVDVFFPQGDGDDAALQKTKFYTQAEAPLHMQEKSEFAEKYQPRRGDNATVEDTIRTKKIVSRTGQVKEIKVLRGADNIDSGDADPNDKGKDELDG